MFCLQVLNHLTKYKNIYEQVYESIMKLLYFMYVLKVNLFSVLVENSRSQSLNLQYIHSSLFDATSCQPTEEDIEIDMAVVNNITDVPMDI